MYFYIIIYEQIKIVIFIDKILLFIYRLFDLIAEDNAIEDATYYLGKALSSEKIDLNSYMKVNLYFIF